MARKTVKVKDIKDQVNNFILHSKDDMNKERLSMGTLLESILMDTDNYRGFGYLNDEHIKESADGTTVGVHWISGKGDFKNTDRSRVFYY